MAIKHSLENYRPVDCPRDYDHLVPHAASIQHQVKDIAIRISYQSHVYSRGAKNSDPSYDFLDEGDNKRVFCEERYNLSLSLPRILCDFLDRKETSWEERDKNSISNLVVAKIKNDEEKHYAIVYYLYPSGHDDYDVELVVKSAYPRDGRAVRNKRRYNMHQLIKKCHFEKRKLP